MGFKNGLLWRLDGDLPRFKNLTTGHPIIMGSKTFDSIGRALPNRTNIVLRKPEEASPQIDNVIVVNSIADAIKIGKEKNSEEIFIIGGGQIYSQTIGLADRLYLTIVDDEPEADTFFPEYENIFKRILSEENHLDKTPPYTFVTLEK